MLKFKRIYVRRYRDNGQVVAYAEHHKGRTEGQVAYCPHPHGSRTPSFGTHMHALFAAAKRQGLHLERETW